MDGRRSNLSCGRGKGGDRTAGIEGEMEGEIERLGKGGVKEGGTKRGNREAGEEGVYRCITWEPPPGRR